ncbi:MAG: MBL fold metallo-hydrolase, partial [Pygmaiobacter sp.]
IPVYASSATLEYLADFDLVPPTAELIALEGKSDAIGGFEVSSFATSHDAVDCHGYRITAPSGGTVAMATDLGIVTDSVYENLKNARLVVLEANYDAVRLRTGSYPYYLKTRIASARGHLCNTDTGAALAKLLGEGCERFALCHLSNENNTTELALSAVTGAFLAAGMIPGKDGLLRTLKRGDITPALEF